MTVPSGALAAPEDPILVSPERSPAQPARAQRLDVTAASVASLLGASVGVSLLLWALLFAVLRL